MSKAGKKYWSTLSPEERSKIMSERGIAGNIKRWGNKKKYDKLKRKSEILSGELSRDEK